MRKLLEMWGNSLFFNLFFTNYSPLLFSFFFFFSFCISLFFSPSSSICQISLTLKSPHPPTIIDLSDHGLTDFDVDRLSRALFSSSLVQRLRLTANDRLTDLSGKAMLDLMDNSSVLYVELPKEGLNCEIIEKIREKCIKNVSFW